MTVLSTNKKLCKQLVMPALASYHQQQATTHKFEFEGQKLTPKELIEKVKNGHWKYLDSGRLYQRLLVHHHNYGDVVFCGKKKNPKKW